MQEYLNEVHAALEAPRMSLRDRASGSVVRDVTQTMDGRSVLAGIYDGPCGSPTIADWPRFVIVCRSVNVFSHPIPIFRYLVADLVHYCYSLIVTLYFC